MPTRPVRVRNVAETDPEAFRGGRQNIRTSAFAFGRGEGRAQFDVGVGLRQLGTQTFAIAQREQQRQADLEVLQAKKKLNDFELSLEAEGGALQRRGEHASGALEETEAQYDRLASELMEKSGPGTRVAIGELTANRRRSILGAVSRHESAEREAVELLLHEEGVAGERDTYAAAPVSEDGVVNAENEQRMVGNITSHWRSVGRIKGLPEDVVKRAIEQDISAAHRGRIERLLGNGEGMKARAYLGRYGDAMTEEDEAFVEDAVRDGANKQEAQDFVDSVQGLPYEEQMDAAKRIEDVELRDEVVTRVNRQHSINEEIRRNNERIARESAWAKQGTPGAELTAFERSVMSGQAIRQWENGHARLLAGLPIVTDAEKRTAFSFLTPEQRRTMTEEEFSNDWRPYFSESDRRWAEGLLRTTREATSSRTPFKVTGAMSRDESIDAAIRRVVGAEPDQDLTKLSGDELRLHNEVLGRIDVAIEEWESANQRTADAPILRKLIAQVERDYVFDEGKLPDAPARVGSFTADTLEDAFVPAESMTQSERADMLAEANRHGESLNDEELGQAVALERIMNSRSAPTALRKAARDRLKAMLGMP